LVDEVNLEHKKLASSLVPQDHRVITKLSALLLHTLYGGWQCCS